MPRSEVLTAAGATDPGLQRDVNEDRFHVDEDRGIFLVVDGVGGQAAGGRAADIALAALRARLERETGSTVDRIREAIASANDEILRVAATRAEWRGMACVLTVVVIEGDSAIVGHVGDTRLYKLRGGALEKITHDHSPVGEREDAGELTEAQAMIHPRRNEVYRDVGSEAHTLDEPGFIETCQIAFEPDASLILCSDGLSDLVDRASIARMVEEHAGHPADTVLALISAANQAGGKDNISAIVVEGGRFGSEVARRGSATRATDRSRHRLVDMALGAVLTALALGAILALDHIYPLRPPTQNADGPATAAVSEIVVHPGESIGATLKRAQAGSTVLVEPGIYDESFPLVSGVRLVSRVPRAATIRVPSDAAVAVAIVAEGLTGAELTGFRIAGEGAMPLGTGIRVGHSDLSIVDVEVTGATATGIDVSDESRVSLLGCDLHDNRGAALAIRPGTAARIAHSTFARNGAASHALLIEQPSDADFVGNVFEGVSGDVFSGLSEAARAALSKGNWFPEVPAAGPAVPAGARGHRGRG